MFKLLGANESAPFRPLPDNGSCNKAFGFRHPSRDLRLNHTPKTNSKSGRFIQRCLREWAYAQGYNHSAGRTAELPFWLHRSN